MTVRAPGPSSAPSPSPRGPGGPLARDYHSRHGPGGPAPSPLLAVALVLPPPGNEWMGGLSARPTAGRTDPAGTCWGQDPGSKMATVIPGPLRWCGLAGGGEGARAGLRGLGVCGGRGWGRGGVWGGLSPSAGLRGGARVCDCGSLTRMMSDAPLPGGVEGVGDLQILFGEGGHRPLPATLGSGRG